MAKVKLTNEKGHILGFSELTNDGSLVASNTQLGNVKIGDNITVANDGTISVPMADQTNAGVIKTNTMHDITDSDWTHLPLGLTTDSQRLPNGRLLVRKSSTESFGVVQIGDLLTLDENGKLTIDVDSLKTALGI